MVYLNIQIEQIAQGLIEAGYSLGDLPAEALVAVNSVAPSSPNAGQLWLSTVDNVLSVYNGVSWQALGLTATEKATLATLSGNVYTASQVDGLISTVNTSIATKQDTLVSGDNIKTVNGVNILGSGNATITAPMGGLNDLQDATINAPTTGQVLSYSGTEWVNTTPVTGITDHTQLLSIGTNTHAQIDTALTRLANTSGTNTGDQDLSGYSLTTHNHSGVYADVSHSHSYLPLAGGTMTGAITALRETKVAMGANNVDLSLGNLFTKTISGATTFTVSNWLSNGNANSFILELTNGGSAVITYPSGSKFAGGTAFTLTASGKDILGCYSHDGGTTLNWILLAKDVK